MDQRELEQVVRVVTEEILRYVEPGAKVIVVGVQPFAFEGPSRREKSIQAIDALRREADSVLVLAQDRIVEGAAAVKNVRHGFHQMHQLLAQTARHLAVRMSYEDVIRVAQAKIDPARFPRIAAQMGVKPDQTFTVTEFLKPGVEEFCSVLPPWLARRVLGFAERHPAFPLRKGVGEDGRGAGEDHRAADALD